MEDSTKDSLPTPPIGLMLRDVCPSVMERIKNSLRMRGATSIEQQLDRTMAEFQVINGTPEKFSFMAYPIPRLTIEEREKMDVREMESFIVEFDGARAKIDLDVFGMVNWFYIDNLPEMHEALQALARRK